MEPTKVMGRRVVAYIIDGLLLSAISFGIFIAMAEKDTEIAERLARGEVSPDDTTYGNVQIGDHEWAIVGGKFLLYVLFALIAMALYQWVLQGIKGWTPGKLITGIRTVREDGAAPGVGRAAARWFLWLADGFPYVIPALTGFIVAMTNDARQRIGDKVAGTFVVRAEAMGRPVTAGGGEVAAPVNAAP